mmetsp:Transcript_11939/g.24592  ORF Transcript_11939/g.24592 Transcript_11939/m.24592 type:complete len:209 (-) Transcript_11939:746-1372(-)
MHPPRALPNRQPQKSQPRNQRQVRLVRQRPPLRMPLPKGQHNHQVRLPPARRRPNLPVRPRKVLQSRRPTCRRRPQRPHPHPVRPRHLQPFNCIQHILPLHQPQRVPQSRPQSLHPLRLLQCHLLAQPRPHLYRQRRAQPRNLRQVLPPQVPRIHRLIAQVLFLRQQLPQPAPPLRRLRHLQRARPQKLQLYPLQRARRLRQVKARLH